MAKVRITISIDRALLDAAHDAIAAGRARSVSEWVDGALALRVEEERRRSSAERAIAELEAKHRVMSDGQPRR